MSRERPILCAADMVRAIANVKVGSWPPEPIDPSLPFQWQDRRPMKPQPYHDKDGLLWWNWKAGTGAACINPIGAVSDTWFDHAPYRVGDRLYVRETWQAWDLDYDDMGYPNGGLGYPLDGIPKEPSSGVAILYGADSYGGDGPWRPSIHMPKWASRFSLEVMRVRAQQLGDITPDDCIAEGILRVLEIGKSGNAYGTPLGLFQRMWRELYGAWEPKRWVWVYDFKRVK